MIKVQDNDELSKSPFALESEGHGDKNMKCLPIQNQPVFKHISISMDSRDATSNFSEGIKVILPSSWKIAASNNVLSISDKNNLDVQIFFSKAVRMEVSNEVPKENNHFSKNSPNRESGNVDGFEHRKNEKSHLTSKLHESPEKSITTRETPSTFNITNDRVSLSISAGDDGFKHLKTGKYQLKSKLHESSEKSNTTRETPSTNFNITNDRVSINAGDDGFKYLKTGKFRLKSNLHESYEKANTAREKPSIKFMTANDRISENVGDGFEHHKTGKSQPTNKLHESSEKANAAQENPSVKFKTSSNRETGNAEDGFEHNKIGKFQLKSKLHEGPVNVNIVRENPSSKEKITSDKVKDVSLFEPLLFKCIDGNNHRKALMFKFGMVGSKLNMNNSIKCSRILQTMLKESKLYHGEPIYLIFNPQKIIRGLKNQERSAESLECTRSTRNNKHQKLRKQLSHKKYLQSKETQTDSQEKVGHSFVQNKETNRTGMEAETSYANPSEYIQVQNIESVKLALNSESREFSITLEDQQEKQRIELFPCKKMSRTALKCISSCKIASSGFRKYFHFYSLYGGHLKSGAVITKSNSNYWLKMSEVAVDFTTVRLASDLFTTFAGTKVVLNIYDYLRFLAVFARMKRLVLVDLVNQMTTGIPTSFELLQNCHQKTARDEETESTSFITHEPSGNLRRFTSLPNLAMDI